MFAGIVDVPKGVINSSDSGLCESAHIVGNEKEGVSLFAHIVLRLSATPGGVSLGCHPSSSGGLFPIAAAPAGKVVGSGRIAHAILCQHGACDARRFVPMADINDEHGLLQERGLLGVVLDWSGCGHMFCGLDRLG